MGEKFINGKKTIFYSPFPPIKQQNQKTNLALQKINNSKQTYKKHVLKSNIFSQSPTSSNGRWPNLLNNKRNDGPPPIRLSDSNPTPKQLEWQKQRRVQTRQSAMNYGGSLGGPKIVQKHAEMRAYLLHCQRVLTARSRLDTGRCRQQSIGHSITSSSITTSPSMDGSWPTTIEGLTVGIKGMRASSVPTKRRIMTDAEKQLRDENKRLLERLVQISTRSTSSKPKLNGLTKENERIKRTLSASLKNSRIKENDERKMSDNSIIFQINQIKNTTK
ncbi:unnamed protein product [Meloidogyne enterolobii]|uniref:Uncharacterized protein n=1 Tax=Meloidogyne enterolobii TaxID=390850 RepID=A0ACB0ZFB3_MELEN